MNFFLAAVFGRHCHEEALRAHSTFGKFSECDVGSIRESRALESSFFGDALVSNIVSRSFPSPTGQDALC